MVTERTAAGSPEAGCVLHGYRLLGPLFRTMWRTGELPWKPFSLSLSLSLSIYDTRSLSFYLSRSHEI